MAEGSTAAEEQDGKWDQALADYNTNVAEARFTYEGVIGNTNANSQDHAVAIVANGAGGDAVGYSLTNKTATIVGGGTVPNKDPQIDLGAAGSDARKYTSYNDAGKKVNINNIENNLTMEYKYTTTTQQDNDNAADEYVLVDDGATPTANPIYTTESGKLADIKGFKDGKNLALENADQAYANAVSALQGTSDITIYINLADDYAANWEFDENTDNTQVASFYYKKILEPGVTTSKLIDSVELADTVKATDYKDLTFDLNVALDSAQVTYEEDQKTYTANAVQAPAFRMDVESITDNVDVAWKDKAPTAQKTKSLSVNKKYDIIIPI